MLDLENLKERDTVLLVSNECTISLGEVRKVTKRTVHVTMGSYFGSQNAKVFDSKGGAKDPSVPYRIVKKIPSELIPLYNAEIKARHDRRQILEQRITYRNYQLTESQAARINAILDEPVDLEISH